MTAGLGHALGRSLDFGLVFEEALVRLLAYGRRIGPNRVPARGILVPYPPLGPWLGGAV